LQNCNNDSNSLSYYPTPGYINAGGSTASQPGGAYTGPFSGLIGGSNCLADGEASVAVKQGLARGPVVTSAVGYTLAYNTLDNNKDPTSGIL
ncbi:hypothetical protein ABTE31_19645, partial [Acinetobacter baumannii]